MSNRSAIWGIVPAPGMSDKGEVSDRTLLFAHRVVLSIPAGGFTARGHIKEGKPCSSA